MIKRGIKVLLLGCCLMAVSFLTNNVPNGIGLFEKEAEAVRGRPMTPRSVAGVARRTTRRVIRRTTYYVATLPAGYTTVVIEGSTLYMYGGTYYQPYDNRYVVVEVD